MVLFILINRKRGYANLRHITRGTSVRYALTAQVLSWEDATARIGELLEQGRFATNVELTEAPGFERQQVAQSLWYLCQDMSDEARKQEWLPTIRENRKSGFPEDVARLEKLLEDPDIRQTIAAELDSFALHWRQNPSVMRFRLYKPDVMLQRVNELSIPHRRYPEGMTELPAVPSFITEDEIDATLSRGGSFEGGAGRIYSFWQQEHTPKEMFQPEGVCLDFGFGAHRYLAFERSGNMSRQATLSFLREDVYEQVRRRIQMDMTIGDCQLSKLYAYNGLMLSGGVRVDGIRIDKPHRVIVVDNPTVMTKDVPVITVEDDGTQNSTRKYHRVERRTDIPITCFDGEGLISKQYAKVVDRAFCGAVVHTSFQIRLPYVKGMLHQVDFHEILELCGQKTITDIWGEKHKVRDVDIILTKSMFKGFGWLKSNNMTWSDYWN
ncbi:MAG: hypothetical protein MSF32_10945, partial [Dysosmobacter sp.]|nr:hypothetical protein [Dysosmobacter sp.]